MKKLFYLILPVVLLLVTCKNAPTEPTFDGTFPDPVFEQVIRDALNLPEGEITQTHLDTLTILWANNWNNLEEKIEDITGIEYCQNLYWLELGWNNISDISTIKKIKTLQTIQLSHNHIENIQALSKLPIVHDLNLSRNNIYDISPLKDYKKIQYLDLGYNQIEDLNSIKTLASLRYLDIEGNEIKSIDALKDLTNLYYLNISINNINDFGPLYGLTNLEWLRMVETGLKHVEKLSTLTYNTSYLLGHFVLKSKEYKGGLYASRSQRTVACMV